MANLLHSVKSRKLSLLLSVIVTALCISYATTSNASAATFSAGRIIDDGVFVNKDSMTANQIQTFLNSKVPNCDTQGSQKSEYGGGTRLQWAQAKGVNPPFTCLKDYSENNKSSAQIIYDIAQQYSINPQVLIVLLQKEEGLVTDSWPLSTQYKTATGYGCPDTAPCDSQYYGLTNQLTWSAKMYRAIMDVSPSWYTPYTVGNNFIRWSPTSSCGGSVVTIENKATQALYNYTPYQPNQAALNAGYGSGDSCSAYGNRNFFLYFTDWFGSTYTPQYSAAYSSQSGYPTLHKGETKTVNLSYVNSGNGIWYDAVSAPAANQYPVVLATAGPMNRASLFANSSWSSVSRPSRTFTQVYENDGKTLAADQHVVRPGQIASYTFTMTAADTSEVKTYSEYFAPVREGASDWFMGLDTVYLNVTVLPTYVSQYMNQSSYPSMSQNSRSDGAFVTYQNTGNVAWYDSTTATSAGQKPIALATAGPMNRASAFSNSSWSSVSRPATTFAAVYESDGMTLAANQHVVAPKQIVKFAFNLSASIGQNPGKYREWFQLVHESSDDWNVVGSVVYLDVTVNQKNIAATYSSQSAYPVITKGTSSTISFDFQNSGSTPWYDQTAVIGTPIRPVVLATTGPINRADVFANSTWGSVSRPSINFGSVYEKDGTTLSANQHVVLPGQIGHYTINLTAPSTMSAGSTREYFQPIVEGAPNADWNIGGTVWQQVQITN